MPSSPKNQENPVLLLDRDGVLNVDRVDYVLSVSQLEILPGVVSALAKLHQQGIQVGVITNQACVGKGLLTIQALTQIHDRLQQIVQAGGGHIFRFYYCPHRPEDHCLCRKPQPGLILQAQQELGFDPACTWLVGDAVRDVAAAQAAGCPAALVRTGKGAETVAKYPDIPHFEDLAAFVQAYLEHPRLLGKR